MSNNQSKFCLLHLQCVFLKILLPTLHKFFKKFHMIYTFLPQLSKNQSVECSRLVSKHKKNQKLKYNFSLHRSSNLIWHNDTFFLYWNFNQNQSKDFSARDIFLWHECSTKIKTRDLSWLSLDYHFLVSIPQKFISDTYIIFSEVREKFVLFKSKYYYVECNFLSHIQCLEIFELKCVSTSSRKSSV